MNTFYEKQQSKLFHSKNTIKILSTLLILIVISLSLYACKTETFDLEKQGSSVIRISIDRTIDNQEVYFFNTYREFAKSEFANLIVSSFGYELKNEAYQQKYFDKKKLVLVLFTANANDDYFIKSIIKNDNDFTIDLATLYSKENENNATYACFIETTDEITDTPNVQILKNDKYKTSMNIPFPFLRNKDERHKLVTSYTELQAFANLDKDAFLQKILYKYDDKYFEDNNLFLAYTYDYATSLYSFTLNTNQIELSVFTSENNQQKLVDEINLVYYEIEKTRNITQFVSTKYIEADINKDLKTTKQTYDIA